MTSLTAAVAECLGRRTPWSSWRYGEQEVVSSIPGRGNIVGWVFHPTGWLERFSLIWICLSFQILNLFRTLSSWGLDLLDLTAMLGFERWQSANKGLPLGSVIDHLCGIRGEALIISHLRFSSNEVASHVNTLTASCFWGWACPRPSFFAQSSLILNYCHNKLAKPNNYCFIPK